MPLDPATRRHLTRAARMQREWRDKRDQAIRDAHGGGASLQEIADAVGLSKAGVAKIVNARTEQ